MPACGHRRLHRPSRVLQEGTAEMDVLGSTARMLRNLAHLNPARVFRREGPWTSSMLLGYGLLALSFAFNLFQAVFIDRLPASWWVAAVHIVFDAAVTSGLA